MTPLRDVLTLSIVSHGHGPLLLRLLADLNAVQPLRNLRVLVTLNLRTENLDPTPFANLRIETIRNIVPKGFGANHNQAFRDCTTEWFGILNPDLRVVDDVFSQLLVHAVDQPAVALLTPRVLNSTGGIEDSVRENLTPLSILKRMLAPRSPRQLPAGTPEFRWYAGMFYLIRSKAYAELAGFDERYFLYCEDYDLCARMHLKEWLLIQAPMVTVVHDAQRDSHRSGQYLRMHLVSLLRVWMSTPVWRIAWRRNA
jgi:GT2 family glycosyltransferase